MATVTLLPKAFISTWAGPVLTMAGTRRTVLLRVRITGQTLDRELR